MPFPGEMPDPGHLARMRAHAEKIQLAEARAQVASYDWHTFFAAITCTCKMFAPAGFDYLEAMSRCPVHATFIVTTEDVLK